MKLSFSNCNRAQLLSFFPAIKLAGGQKHGRKNRWVKMDSGNRCRREEKIIVIMGATGTGKSRLSIDLATRFPSEIINADKMQVYRGLDVTTNKVSYEERRGVTHHLLGDIDPTTGEISAHDFRQLAGAAISSIASRGRLPIVVGGSNSYIQALVSSPLPDSRHSAGDSVGYGEYRLLAAPVPVPLFRYECCFLWIDVSLPVLFNFVTRRVDEMMDAGMLEELAEFYDPNADTSRGLRKAIGVPEFDAYFRHFLPEFDVCDGDLVKTRDALFEEAVKAIKENTCKLALRQTEKIRRLRSSGWNLNRIDATEAFQAISSDPSRQVELWEKLVVEPSMKILKRFICSVEECY